MLEPQLIESPLVFPYCCILCRSQKGPIADTNVEIPSFGRAYLCQLCAKTYAKLYGFAEGTELDIREEAIDEANALRRENTQLLEQLGDSSVEIASLRKEKREAITELEARAAPISQLENTLRESAAAAQAHLALVGGQSSS